MTTTETKASNKHVVPRLPILSPENRREHAKWHAYFSRVYGESVPEEGVDLNAFEWFYGFAPLSVTPLWDASVFEEGLAFAGNTSGYYLDRVATWYPDSALGTVGFFVHREEAASARRLDFLRLAQRLEVLRVAAPERGAVWFYHCPGSGVFLELAGRARAVVRDRGELSPPWPRGRLADRGAAEYMRANDYGVLVFARAFSRFCEIVVRLDGSVSGACPPSSVPLSSGWSAPRPCDCAPDARVLNCGFVGALQPSRRFAPGRLPLWLALPLAGALTMIVALLLSRGSPCCWGPRRPRGAGAGCPAGTS